jgi:hypothetical protein
MDGSQEELRLLENIVEELQHIKEKLDNKLSAIVADLDAANLKLDQIITNTTPTPSDDIVSLGGSISTPKKQNP